MRLGLINYIGGKHRIAGRLVEACAATKAETFVDVFGGSAAVFLAAAGRFRRLIYNDVDGDLVNLFRVVSESGQRQQLFKLLRWLPPSRRVFSDDYQKYVAGGFSFCRIQNPVERARATFYRHHFAFGGKVRSGGFAVSTADDGAHPHIKEVVRYQRSLRSLAAIGTLFRGAVIENLHYQELIRAYGTRPGVVLFIDPPYVGSEKYYSRTFNAGDHAFLAEQLATTPARVVCTYYDHPAIRSLYPSPPWVWSSIQATKNSRFGRGNKVMTNEFVLTKTTTAV